MDMTGVSSVLWRDKQTYYRYQSVSIPTFLSKPGHFITTWRQNVIFVGRTSGCSIGYVRTLRPCHSFIGEIRLCHRVVCIGVLTLQKKIDSGFRGQPGDDGVWVYERLTGRLVPMVIEGAANTETLRLSLSEIFEDIERVTKHKPSLPQYYTFGRYSPSPDDDDLGLINAYRTS